VLAWTALRREDSRRQLEVVARADVDMLLEAVVKHRRLYYVVGNEQQCSEVYLGIGTTTGRSPRTRAVWTD